MSSPLPSREGNMMELAIWYCPVDGQTHRQWPNDPTGMACTDNHYMHHATLTYNDPVPDPDPLESLLIDGESA